MQLQEHDPEKRPHDLKTVRQKLEHLRLRQTTPGVAIPELSNVARNHFHQQQRREGERRDDEQKTVGVGPDRFRLNPCDACRRRLSDCKRRGSWRRCGSARADQTVNLSV